MPLFGEARSPYDDIVEKVTAETLTSENWALMMDICDRVSHEGTAGSKQCLLSVKKRLNHRDPHVVLFALSLLDCLWNNCGTTFRREVSSKEFINELNYKATNSNNVIGEKTRLLIKKWVDNECKKDTSLSLVETLYKNLLEDGFTFDSGPEKKMTKLPDDPNVVMSEQEEADIAKAIAMSLKESEKAPKAQSYPSLSSTTNVSASSRPKAAQRQVRALYDFEAAEDNELSFAAGDIIMVVDDSDPNWWRGESHRNAGLFPASFVTSELQQPREKPVEQPVQPQKQEEPPVQIDENILLKCISLLDQCDPETSQDPPELAYYEQASMAQGPLIDQKLALIDKQHNMLAQIDVAIRDVLAAYDNAVQQVQYQMPQGYTATNVPPASYGTYPAGSNMPPSQASAGAPMPQHPQQDWQAQHVDPNATAQQQPVPASYAPAYGMVPQQQQQDQPAPNAAFMHQYKQ
ncbi:Variant SH3 domain containing protein [Aphelenchoides avenae]|nr:Variant SH3 domain containing protein [Aphelenchus avenae]